MIAVLISLFSVLQAAPAPQAPTGPAAEILRSFTDDFRSDPAAAVPHLFGVEVRGAEPAQWHVEATGRKDADGLYAVELRPGVPPRPTFRYVTDLETLRKIGRGELNALTAMGKARQSDFAPMDLDVLPGFEPGPEFVADVLPFSFHFWTRGFPETVPFGPALGRGIHGATMVIFYYQPGLRSGWGEVRKGQRINADPKDQVNPFPSMFICIKGRAMMKLAGKEREFSAGRMIFVPAGTAHEAWNPWDEPAEVIVLMFGDGA